MTERRIHCQISVPEALAEGRTINAFRIVRDGEEWLLDFLILSDDESRAVVVSRIRVQPEFLAAIRTRLDFVLQDATAVFEVFNDSIPFRLLEGVEVN